MKRRWFIYLIIGIIMITGVILDICNMSVTWMCMVEGEDNPELIEKILVMHGK